MTTPYTYGYRAGHGWYKYGSPATNPYGYDSESGNVALMLHKRCFGELT